MDQNPFKLTGWECAPEVNQSSGQFRPTDPPAIPDHQLLKSIGGGSYGTVWLARSSMGMYRAIKVVYRSSFSNEKPFQRELSGIRRFEPISRSHEGFIDILQVGINEEKGYFYCVMELGDDQNSGQNIDPQSYSPKTLGKEISQKGRLAYGRCLELGLALSQALAELHKNNLVHRDVKPSNIIFVNGVPKLADMGLVAELKEAASYVGTEGFIPPEGPGAPQADVYGLGKVLYEASTGKDRKDFPDLPTLLADFPDQQSFMEMNEVIVRACQNQIGKRYQSAWDMYADLVVLANGKSVKRLNALERRLANFKKIGAVAAAGVVFLAGIGVLLHREKLKVVAGHIHQDILFANSSIDAGNLPGALPYIADALEANGGDRDREVALRMRYGATQALCPKLAHFWIEPVGLDSGQFSPDGSKIVLVQDFGDAKVFDLRSEKAPPQTLERQPGLVDAAFSHDGRFMATACEGGSVSTYNTTFMKRTHLYEFSKSVFSVRYSPNGKWIIAACNDGLARVLDAETGRIDMALPHSRGVRFADYSADGKHIVTCCEDHYARLWDATTGALIGQPLEHHGWVYYAAFSPDGKRLATASGDHKARVWDVATERQISPDLLLGDAVKSVEFSPDGTLLLTTCLDGSVHLYQADDFQPATSTPILQQGERATYATFDPEGRRILVTCADGSVKIWDLAGELLPLPTNAPVNKDGGIVAWLSTNILEIKNLFETNKNPIFIRSVSPINSATFDKQSGFLITTSIQDNFNHHDKLLQLWNSKTGVALGGQLLFNTNFDDWHLSNDGKKLIATGGSYAWLWDVPNGIPAAPEWSHPAPVNLAVFSPDGIKCATASERDVYIWSTVTGKSMFSPLHHDQPVKHVEFSHDNSRLISCCADPLLNKCYAQMWDASTGKPIGPRLYHGDGVLSCTFSPDDTRVATGGEDFVAILWDARTGNKIAKLHHQEKVMSVAFSTDGNWLLTASVDKTARIWNAYTGDALTPPLRHQEMLVNAIFLNSNSRVMITDVSGEHFVWQIPADTNQIGDIQKVAQILAPDIEVASDSRPSSPREPIISLYRKMASEDPSYFIVSVQDAENWHETVAEDARANHKWAAMIFHLDFLQALHPGDQSLSNRLEEASGHLNIANK